MLLFFTAAVAENAQIPILIDGVRVAFFDADGGMLTPKEENGLLYVPLQAFCENMSLSAEVQGQSVAVDGTRIGMFDEAGNFLTPVQTDGVDYVPLAPFCNALGIQIAEENGGFSVTRKKAEQPAAETKAQTGKIALTEYNFNDYFSYSFEDRNFQATQRESYIDSDAFCNNVEVDYVVTCNARSAFEIENVTFTLYGFLSETDQERCGFWGVAYTVDMPANGSYSHTYHKSDFAFVDYTSDKATSAALQTTFVKQVSGYLIVEQEKADAANLASYQKGEELIKAGEFSDAEKIFFALNTIDYPNAQEKYDEAKAKYKEAENALLEAETKAIENTYLEAMTKEQAGEYQAAIELYSQIPDYKDSIQRKQNIIEQLYQKAMACEQDGDYDKAIEIYQSIEDYRDSAQRSELCQYEKLPVTQIGVFREGYLPVEKDGKWGYVNAEGRMVIPCIYEEAYSFSDGVAYVVLNEKTCFINHQNEIVLTSSYDRTGAFYNGLASACTKYSDCTKYGFIDKTGKLVISQKFVSDYYIEGDFSQCSLAPVMAENKLYGCIDQTGKFVIPAKYDKLKIVDEDTFIVQSNGQWFVIDREEKIKIAFDKPYRNVRIGGNYYIAQVDESYILLLLSEEDGSMIHEFSDDVLTVGKFSDGLAWINKEWKFGFINESFQEVIPFNYQYAGDFEDGFAIVEDYAPQFDKVEDGKTVTGYGRGIIDIYGNLVIPADYNAIQYGDGCFFLLKGGKITVMTLEEMQAKRDAMSNRRVTIAPVPTATPEPVTYTTLKPGSNSQEVLDARLKLYELGYFKKKPTQTKYTDSMSDYVKKFEKDHGLTQDGVLSSEDQEVLFGL